jgi:8-oxo-dGTP pyrophosphatase MutT (NUDIX family)
MKGDKLLILKRSDKVGTYKGLWGGVAGYVEENEEPYETALKEIKEEVGIEKKMSVL